MNTYRIKQQGFAILEVIIASLIFTAVALSIASLQQQILKTSTETREANTKIDQAGEKIDRIYNATNLVINKAVGDAKSSRERAFLYNFYYTKTRASVAGASCGTKKDTTLTNIVFYTPCTYQTRDYNERMADRCDINHFGYKSTCN